MYLRSPQYRAFSRVGTEENSSSLLFPIVTGGSANGYKCPVHYACSVINKMSTFVIEDHMLDCHSCQICYLLKYAISIIIIIVAAAAAVTVIIIIPALSRLFIKLLNNKGVSESIPINS